jgi:hypothetical protein
VNFVELTNPERPADKQTGIFIVVSECSKDGANGNKIRRRLEACAKLASVAEAILATANPSTS